MSKTEPSLRLFNILFWIFWLTLIIWGVSLSLFESMGRYSNHFRLLVIISYVSADVVLMILLEKLKTKYVRGQCLSQTSNSAFGGKHRRNIFSGQETRIYTHLLQFAFVFEQILLIEPFNIFGQKKVQSLTTLVLVFFSTIGTVWKEPSKPGSSCPYGDNKNSGTMKLGQMFYCIYLKTQPFYPEGCLAQTTHKKKLNHQYKFVNEHPPS